MRPGLMTYNLNTLVCPNLQVPSGPVQFVQELPYVFLSYMFQVATFYVEKLVKFSIFEIYPLNMKYLCVR
jgi:hypothetical protein